MLQKLSTDGWLGCLPLGRYIDTAKKLVWIFSQPSPHPPTAAEDGGRVGKRWSLVLHTRAIRMPTVEYLRESSNGSVNDDMLMLPQEILGG